MYFYLFDTFLKGINLRITVVALKNKSKLSFELLKTNLIIVFINFCKFYLLQLQFSTGQISNVVVFIG